VVNSPGSGKFICQYRHHNWLFKQ